MHFITLTFHWYFQPGSSSPRPSRLVEVTRHFLLLGCCPCNQVGKTKAFQRERTVNFNLTLTQVEKYMEELPYSDLRRCKIVFSFGIIVRFYSAYCTFGVSHGSDSSCLLSILTSSAHWGTACYCWRDAYCQYTPPVIPLFGGQHLNIIIFWYLA